MQLYGAEHYTGVPFLAYDRLFPGYNLSDSRTHLFKKMRPCHRPGDAAPFSLITYADISKRISFIKEVINQRLSASMAGRVHYRDFADNRMLTEQEKQALLKWIDEKAPRVIKGSPEKTLLERLRIDAN